MVLMLNPRVGLMTLVSSPCWSWKRWLSSPSCPGPTMRMRISFSLRLIFRMMLSSPMIRSVVWGKGAGAAGPQGPAGRDAGLREPVQYNRTGGRGLEEGRRAKGRTAGGRGGGEVGRRGSRGGGIRLPSNGCGAGWSARSPSPVAGRGFFGRPGGSGGLLGTSQANYSFQKKSLNTLLMIRK